MIAHPLVSVVIPVYNVEKYLRQCLDSVLKQTLHEIEIICVNDGSPDNSLSILREYENKDERVKVIDFPENRGVSAARNAGLVASKSPYVAFLDSDDWVKPEMYENLYAAVTSHPDISVAYCDYMAVKDNCMVDRVSYSEWPAGKHLPSVLFRENFIQIWCCLFKKDLLTEHDIRFPEGCWFEDLLSVVGLAVSKHITRVPIALHNYRIVEGSFCRSTNYHPTFTGISAVEYFTDMLTRLGIRKKYPEEVDFFEIRILLELSLTAFWKFDPPALQYLPVIRKALKGKYPDFRGNKYYKNLPLKNRLDYRLLMQGNVGTNLFLLLRWGKKLILGKSKKKVK